MERSLIENESSFEQNENVGSELVQELSTGPTNSFKDSFQNVSRLLSHFTIQLDQINQKPTKDEHIPELNQLYEHLLKGISILPASSTVPNLASLAVLSKKRKLSDSDKQLRLVANKKSKPGRKPLKQLKKPDSPEKKELIDALLKPLTPKKLKDVAAEAETVPKKRPGRPKKLNFASLIDTSETKTNSKKESKKPKKLNSTRANESHQISTKSKKTRGRSKKS